MNKRLIAIGSFLLILLFCSSLAAQVHPDDPDPIEPEQNLFVGLKMCYFGAPWCVPCQLMKPTLRMMLLEGVPLYQEDITKDRTVADLLNVKVLPTIVFIHDGKEVARLEGYQPYRKIRNKWLELQAIYPPDPVPDSFPDNVPDIDEDDSGIEIHLQPEYRITDEASAYRNQVGILRVSRRGLRDRPVYFSHRKDRVSQGYVQVRQGTGRWR